AASTRTRPRRAPERPTTKRTAGARGVPAAGPSDRGRVWVLADNRLQPVPVRLGVSDGTSTAILDGQLQEGADVVPSVAAAAASTKTASASGSPLIPQFPGRGNRAG